MADFCNKCNEELFPNTPPGIDVNAIFKKLKEGEYLSVICEGCAMDAIGNIDGKMMVNFGEAWVEYTDETWKKRYDKFA